MQPSTVKLVPRRNSAMQEIGGGDPDARRPDLGRSRVEPDWRPKPHHDKPSASNCKGKGKARHIKAASKKRRVIRISDSDSSAEEIADVDPNWSHGHPSAEEDDSDEDSDNADSRSDSPPRRRHSHGKAQKKPVTLDVNGMPWGTMKECLSDDIKKYAKSLDATANWESQPAVERQQLFRRLYKEWDMLGQSYKLNNKWITPIITKVLITTRWRLNTLIDAGQPKPADVTDEQWDTLMRRRKTEGSQVISDHMRSISQGRASKSAQLKSIERDAIVKLTLQRHRKPYATEIMEEVGHEYNRQQQERRNVALQKGNDIEDVRSRVVEIETSVARLGETVETSQQRLVEMLNAILSSQGVKFPAVPEVDVLPLVGAVDGDMPPLLSAGDNSASPKKPLFPNVVTLQPGASVEGSTGKGNQRLDEQHTANAPSVDDFLAGMLHNPHQLHGIADTVQPLDAVFVTARNGNAEDAAVASGLAELGNPYATPSTVYNGTNSNVAVQDDTATETTSTERHSIQRPHGARDTPSSQPLKGGRSAQLKVWPSSKALQGMGKVSNYKKVDALRKK